MISKWKCWSVVWLTCLFYVDVVAEDNSSRPFQLRLMKILCVDQPYNRSVVHYCKTVLRRNQPTMLNISITIPFVIDFCYITIKIDYKFNEYQPFLFNARAEGCQFLRERPVDPLSLYLYNIFAESLPTLVRPCPHGNRTYDILWTMDERLSPRSVPAGDYRVTAIWEAEEGDTIIHLQIYCAVRRKGIFRSMIEW
uniref:MD-2-related lipid-recognition domain-containing protein n=1 Tax=Anopheles stephensi TaxID=30069 RepID=A0A182YDZ5_ANOST